jgi:soluble cytochrome b562
MKTLDTRDLDNRKDELEALRDAVTDAQSELDQHRDLKPEEDSEEFAEWEEEEESLEESLQSAYDNFGSAEEEELAELEELESEISGWLHGETLIPVDDWEDYAREFAEDIGAIDRNAKWPYTCIDWEEAARELAYDYAIVSYQGDDYYVRS